MPEAEALKPEQFKCQGIFNFETIQVLLYWESHWKQQYLFLLLLLLGGIKIVLIFKTFLYYNDANPLFYIQRV